MVPEILFAQAREGVWLRVYETHLLRAFRKR